MTEFGGNFEGGRHALVEQESAGTIKDSWFNATLRGISIVPQANREGAAIMLGQAVLTEPPVSWNDFFKSELSDEQLKNMQTAMDSHHRNADVAKSSKKPPKEETTAFQRAKSAIKREHIPPERLQLLWEGAKQEVARVFLGYIDKQYYPPVADRGIADYEYDKIAQFFDRAEYADEAGKLKEILDIAAGALMDEEGKELSKTYKTEAKKPRDKRDTLPKIRAHVVDRVNEQIPGAGKLDWLYGRNATLPR
jgi:hypothetical protein